MEARRRGMPEWLVVACGVWHIGLGIYFIFVRPSLLPEDTRYMSVAAQTLQASVPGLAAWLGKVFTAMGGFMAGAGVLIAYFGWTVMPLRLRGTTFALALTGSLTIGLMSAVNFSLNLEFRWLLALPPVGWLAALLAYSRGHS